MTDTFPTMYAHSVGDKMRVAGLGELPIPATCMVCGSGNCDEGYLIWGVFFEYEGDLLTCLPCFFQAAEKTGCVPPVIAREVKERFEEIKILREANEALNERLATYDSLLSGLVAPSDATSSLFSETASTNESDESQSTNGEQHANVKQPAEPSKSTKVRAAKPGRLTEPDAGTFQL